MSEVQDILLELDRAKHRDYGVFLQAQELLSRLVHHASSQSIEDITSTQQFEVAAFEITTLVSAATRDSTKSISHLVSKLNELQQIELVSSPDHEYTAYLQNDFSYIDALSLKTEAFTFIHSPSQKVIEAHQLHLSRIRRNSEI